MRNHNVFCGGILWGVGLGQATKKSKITKIKECATTFWELRDLSGGSGVSVGFGRVRFESVIYGAD